MVRTLFDGQLSLRYFDRSRPTVPTFESWDAMRAWLAPLRGFPLLWRGHLSCSWPLRSRLERTLRDRSVPEHEWSAIEEACVARFRGSAAPVLSGRFPGENRLAWLSIMQHYGAPTRLTDWSSDPFVALFFAYRDSTNDDRALFVLNLELCRDQYGTSDPPVPPGDELTMSEATAFYQDLTERFNAACTSGLSWPLPLPALRNNPRMDAQRAAFVCDATLRSPLEMLLTDEGFARAKVDVERIDNEGRWRIAGNPFDAIAHLVHRDHVIQKIKLPNAWRDEVRACIGRHGIAEELLFPDRRGVEGQLDRIGAQVERFVDEWPTGE